MLYPDKGKVFMPAEDVRELRTGIERVEGILSLSDQAVAKAVKIIDGHFTAVLKDSGIDIVKLLSHNDAAPSSCGHLFERGDVIYRCKECTDDETCVLCSKCFQEADHAGHPVTFSISGGSGGSCDCGEDESWKRPLSCPLHQIGEPSEILDPKTEELIDDYCLSIFKAYLRELLVAPFEGDDPGSESLVLFNDEKHSYDDVITVLVVSKIVNPHESDKAAEIAKTIDQHGFAVIKTAENAADMTNAQQAISYIGLTVSVMKTRQILDCIVAYCCLLWLEKKCEDCPSLRSAFMKAILKKRKGDPFNESLLTFCLNFEEMMCKGAKAALNSILIKCAFPYPALKAELARQYGIIFPMMLEKLMNNELREPEHSFVHFSVQLFTVSSIIRDLVIKDGLFKSLCKTIQRFNRSGQLMDIKNMPKNLIMAIHIFQYIFRDPYLKKSGFLVTEASFKHLFDTFVKPFEGMNIQSRASTAHVAFENKKWPDAFSIHIELTELFDMYMESVPTVDAALKLINDRLVELPKEQEIRPTFHYLSLTLYAAFIRRIWKLSPNGSAFTEALRKISPVVVAATFSKAMISTIFLNEIELGDWVRNGFSMASQLHLFKYSLYRSMLWDSLVCTMKASAIIFPISTLLTVFADNAQKFPDTKDTKNLHFGLALMNIFFSSSFNGLDHSDSIKEVLIAILSTRPATFSEIEASLPYGLKKSTNVSVVLKEVANISTNAGFEDAVFELKQDYCGMASPFFWLYGPEQREKLFERCKTKNIRPEEVLFNFKNSSQISMEEFSVLPLQQVDSPLFINFCKLLMNSKHAPSRDIGVALFTLIMGSGNPIVLTGIIPELNPESQQYVEQVLKPEQTQKKSDENQKQLAAEAKRRALEKLSASRAQVKIEDGESVSQEDLTVVDHCVVCQEVCSTSAEPFGTFALIQGSSGDVPGIIDVTGCMHCVHFSCFKTVTERSHTCPLCSTVFNFFLPYNQLGLIAFSEMSIAFSQADDYLIHWIESGKISQLCIDNVRKDPPDASMQFAGDLLEPTLKSIFPHRVYNETFHCIGSSIVHKMKAMEPYGPEYIQTMKILRQFAAFFVSCYHRDWWLFPVRTAMILGQSSINCDEALSIVDMIFLFSISMSPQASAIDLAVMSRILIFIYQTNNPEVHNVYGDLVQLFSMWFDYIPSDVEKQQIASFFQPKYTSISCPQLEVLIPKVSKYLIQGSAKSIAPQLNLFALNNRYDKLLIEYAGKACSNCSTVPQVPTICMFCGALLCALSDCCTEYSVGECNLHAEKCQRRGGMFLVLKKNFVILLGCKMTGQFTGCVINSPYLDANGQADRNLHRGQLLFLDESRLNLLKKIWVTGKFDTFITCQRNADHQHEWNWNLDWTSF